MAARRDASAVAVRQGELNSPLSHPESEVGMDEDLRQFVCVRCCPKCGGALFRECDIYGCDVECLQCGYVMPRTQLEQLVGKEAAAQLLRLSKRRAIKLPSAPPPPGRGGS